MEAFSMEQDDKLAAAIQRHLEQEGSPIDPANFRKAFPAPQPAESLEEPPIRGEALLKYIAFHGADSVETQEEIRLWQTRAQDGDDEALKLLRRLPDYLAGKKGLQRGQPPLLSPKDKRQICFCVRLIHDCLKPWVEFQGGLYTGPRGPDYAARATESIPSELQNIAGEHGKGLYRLATQADCGPRISLRHFLVDAVTTHLENLPRFQNMDANRETSGSNYTVAFKMLPRLIDHALAPDISFNEARWTVGAKAGDSAFLIK